MLSSQRSFHHMCFSSFGSGGISLKPSPSMDAMRADMGGAATVCASVVTAAALKLPINIIGELLGNFTSSNESF